MGMRKIQKGRKVLKGLNSGIINPEEAGHLGPRGRSKKNKKIPSAARRNSPSLPQEWDFAKDVLPTKEREESFWGMWAAVSDPRCNRR